MSDAESGSQSGAGRREVAYRVFAAEYDDATYSYSAGEEERAPNYVITPSGARANRLFVVGVLTEVETVSDGVLRARVVDPTGAFVLYAGQYQPDEQAMLEAATTPTFVAVTGKARTFQPEDSDRVFTSVRPESISEVDAETRDRWTVQAAEQTLARIGHVATALADGARGDELRRTLTDRGVDEGLADGIAIAIERYGTTTAYLDALRETAVGAAAVVAGEHESVPELTTATDAPGGPAPETLVDLTGSLSTPEPADPEPAAPEPTVDEPAPAETETTGAVDESGTDDRAADAASEPAAEVGTTADADTEADTGVSQTGSEEDDRDPVDLSATADAEESTLSEPTIDDADEGIDDPGEFDTEFELEEETRKEIEAEYGTEFQSGTDVDEPGNADIDVPGPDETGGIETSAPSSTDETDETDETDPTGSGSEPEKPEDTAEPATGESETADRAADAVSGSAGGDDPEDDRAEAEPGPDETGETDEADEAGGTDRPEDPQAALIAVLEDLDDGAGADRESVRAAMVERHGIAPEETEELVKEALMSGQCYEPDDSSLKPI